MILEMQDGTKMVNPSQEQVREALRRLNGGRVSYASLNGEKGSYVQVGGGPAAFTVEARETYSGGTFRHWKARKPGAPGGETRHLLIGGQAVKVDSAEFLPFDLVVTLFHSFAAGVPRSSAADWSDITHWFDNAAGDVPHEPVQVQAATTVRGVLVNLVHEGFAPVLTSRGFKLYKSLKFVRKLGSIRQELGVHLAHGYVDMYTGFQFRDVQALAAELEGEPQRKDWFTASANIGNLQTPPSYLNWEIDLSTDVEQLGKVMADVITHVAMPFWDRYTTLEALYEGYQAGDHRLRLGGEHFRWGYAAVCCLLGRPAEARQVLAEWRSAVPRKAKWRQL